MFSSIARAAEGVGIALDSIRASKVRSALTILGIAIGVMVVVGMAAAITGINRAVSSQLESMGPKTFFVFRFFEGGINISDGSEETSPWRRRPWLTVEEAQLLRQLPAVREVAWEEGTGGPVTYRGVELTGARIGGFSPAWVQVTGGTLVAGRSFTAMEYAASAYVAVINEPMAEAFFSGVDPIGKVIKVFGVPFTVIGVWVQADVMFGNNDRPRLAIPHTTFTKVADYWKGWMEFSVIPTETATVQEAQDQVVAALRAKRGLKPNEDNTFDVVGQDKLLDSFNSITRVFFLVMLALSGVGLMVGGVGVVAIMMISVTERTREIGVRKALGATRAEIMFQFLVEAATLTVVGGAAGLLLGGLITLGVNKWTPIPAAIPLWSVAAALIASVITGVFFGLYPANRASKLDPVEALRYE
jgi:putative ABC transport system permease protein